MSGVEDFAPESEEEYEQRRQELIEDAAQTKQELEAEQQEALEAIRSGGELERYETVTLGELDIEVKSWIPGDITGTIRRAQHLADSEDLDQLLESMETMLSALDEMTTNDTYNMQFWRAYFSEWGPEGIMEAVETILSPAVDSMEERGDSIESFRKDG